MKNNCHSLQGTTQSFCYHLIHIQRQQGGIQSPSNPDSHYYLLPREHKITLLNSLLVCLFFALFFHILLIYKDKVRYLAQNSSYLTLISRSCHTGLLLMFLRKVHRIFSLISKIKNSSALMMCRVVCNREGDAKNSRIIFWRASPL